MENTIVTERLRALRTWMRKNLIDAFVVPSTDPHNGEYVPDYWKAREWISGFNGSAGIAVVTADKAALWTDSRYFIAAGQQLEGTGFELMRERLPETPTIAEWLGSVLEADKRKCRVGADGMVMTAADVATLLRSLQEEGDFELVTDKDPFAEIWIDRPELPNVPVELHPLEYTGEETRKKLARIREAVKEQYADGLFVTSLDDIAWTLNLRGSDVHCNPVFVSYLLVEKDKTTLFVKREKLTDEVVDYLYNEGVDVADYDEVLNALAHYTGKRLLADPFVVNHRLLSVINADVVEDASPIPALKAVKNVTEIEGYRKAMLYDGVAMVRFLHWLRPAVEKGGQTEMSIDRKLTELRAEQPCFKGLSFDTIAAYGEHAAIVHYEATPETDAVLKAKGMLLLDSGAQYLNGTTDITRTVALGPVTEEEREVYTRVLKAHIQLEMLKFPIRANGTQLDAVARKELWKVGLNYLHGTGHGVGAYLNVHEGPHQIRMEYKPAPLLPGMTVTDEPGVYAEGKYGVRIENLMLIKPYMTTDFGEFLQFEPLTLCPIDLTPVKFDLLDDEELEWLNQYHQTVYDHLAPLLETDVRNWLAILTKKVTKDAVFQ